MATLDFSARPIGWPVRLLGWICILLGLVLLVYLAIWVGTLVWAWWEVGADWWAQLPRVFAPTLLLVLVLICIPALSRRPAATRSRREPRRPCRSPAGRRATVRAPGSRPGRGLDAGSRPAGRARRHSADHAGRPR